MKKSVLFKFMAILLTVCVLFAGAAVTALADEPKDPPQGNVEILNELVKPVLTAAERDYRTVILTWNKVDGADGYEIFADNVSKASTTDTTYVFDGALPSVASSYSVKAYIVKEDGSREYSEPSNEVTVTTNLKAPVVKTTVATSSKKIKITWNSVDGARGYEVYVNETLIAAVNKGTSYTYTTSNKLTLTWGKKYNVQVLAYCSIDGNTYYSEPSAADTVTMRPEAVTIRSAKSAGYDSIKVTWKKLSGASGYYVYRKTGSGKYKKIATVSGGAKVSYTDKKASLGKTFTYKVRAYWKSGKKVQAGAYSAEKAAKTALSTPKLTKPGYRSSQIEVKWKKVPGATGYYIYRKTSAKAKWRKKIATVKGGSKVAYVDKNVKKNKKYYYTVKAYRKSGSKTYTSGYDQTGRLAQLKIKIREKTIKDKNSAMYGKKIRLYVNADGTVVQDVESIIGKQSSYQIYVNKAKNQVTVYAKDGKVYIPVKSFVCTVGKSSTETPSGTFTTKYKYRWQEMMGPSWGQWVTRITWDGVLFHSVYYNSLNNNNNLSVAAYNNLGHSASHGCVRLTAGDAKWIYDNCRVGTKVVIYSKSGYEPLKKPTAYKLPSWHTWDPTDPNMKSKCKKRGCH